MTRIFIPLHYLFLLLALSFGGAMIFINPPGQGPDESNHFHRTSHILTGSIMGCHLHENRLGGEIDEAYLQLTSHFDSIMNSDVVKYDDEDFRYINGIQKTGKRAFTDFANVGYYSPTLYIPHVIGIGLSRLFNLKPINELYIGRISGFLFWIGVIFFSIKIIPVYKELFTFLALLPASLSINTNLSGDTVSNALSFFWIATMFSAIYTGNKKLSWRWVGLLVLSIFVTSINKPVYFPLVFLLFLVPDEMLPTPRLLKYGIPGLTMLVVVLWSLYSSGLFIPYDRYDTHIRDAQGIHKGVDPGEQLEYIVTHPLSFAKTSLISYAETARATWAHYIGKFGWYKNYLPTWLIGILSLYMLLLLLLKNMERPFSFPKKHRKVFLAISLTMILAVTVSLYMQWNPVGNDRVWSLSGRYFIPVFPLFFLAISRPTFKISYLQSLLIVVILAGLTGLLNSVYNTFY